MNRSRIAVFAGAFALAAALSSSIAQADTLTGTTVSGSMAASGHYGIQTQFTSPAVVGPGTEFSGVLTDNNLGQTYDITADFYDGGLTVEVASPDPGANVRNGAGTTQWSLTFSDPAFETAFTLADFTCAPSTACASYSPVANVLSGDTLSGTTLTLDFSGAFAGSIYTFTDVPAAAATPEPSAIALLGTGLLGLGALVRRRVA